MGEFTNEMIQRTLVQNEGEKFTDFRNDAPTKWGIIPSDIEECIRDGLLPKIDDIVEYIKKLTLDEAASISKHLYFDKLLLSKIAPYQTIVEKIFDLAMPLGRRQVTLCVQRACRSVNANQNQLKEDGIMGLKTIMVINSCFDKQLLSAFRSECAGVFRLIVKAKPEKEENIGGWLRRSYE
jgi:lysozyme family protein